MWQQVLIGLIIAAGVLGLARAIYRSLTGRGGCPGCGHSFCCRPDNTPDRPDADNPS